MFLSFAAAAADLHEGDQELKRRVQLSNTWSRDTKFLLARR